MPQCQQPRDALDDRAGDEARRIVDGFAALPDRPILRRKSQNRLPQGTLFRSHGHAKIMRDARAS